MEPFKPTNFSELEEEDEFLIIGGTGRIWGTMIEGKPFFKNYHGDAIYRDDARSKGFMGTMSLEKLCKWFYGYKVEKRPSERQFLPLRSYVFNDYWAPGEDFFTMDGLGPYKCEFTRRSGILSEQIENETKCIEFYKTCRRMPTEKDKEEFNRLSNYYEECLSSVIPRPTFFTAQGTIYTHPSFISLPSFMGAISQHRSCIGCAKTTENITTWIPTEHTNFFGYSRSKIEEYVQFLNDMFLAEVISIKGFNVSINEANIIKANKIEAKVEGNLHNNDFTNIVVKGSKENTFATYVRFVCLRYLYDQEYAHIPRICLFLRKKMPKQVTNWHILIMAHTYRFTDPHYGLLSDTVPRLNKTLSEFLAKAAVLKSVNNAWDLSSYNFDHFNQLWNTRDYSSVYETLLKI